MSGAGEHRVLVPQAAEERGCDGFTHGTPATAVSWCHPALPIDTRLGESTGCRGAALSLPIPSANQTLCDSFVLRLRLGKWHRTAPSPALQVRGSKFRFSEKSLPHWAVLKALRGTIFCRPGGNILFCHSFLP